MRAKILVVEDDPDIAEAFQANLEGAGHEVFWASDGIEALRLLDRESPDLATVDLMVPSVSGFRLVELLKRRRADRPIPVVVVTAMEFEEAEEVARSGADDFLTKPTNPEELLRRVEDLLSRRERKAGGLAEPREAESPRRSRAAA